MSFWNTIRDFLGGYPSAPVQACSSQSSRRAGVDQRESR
jgi:hypothetical protein